MGMQAIQLLTKSKLKTKTKRQKTIWLTEIKLKLIETFLCTKMSLF